MKRTACALAVAALMAGFPIGSSATPEPETPELPTIGGGEIVAHDIVEYAAAVQRAEVGDYLVAVQEAEAEAARVAAEQTAAALAAQARPSPKPSAVAPSAPSGGGVGECTGFAIPDYVIQRESGGNAFIQNPSSDAFGCAQTLLSHYSSGSCSGLDPYTIEGQRQCVNILSNGGTNLAPWALTR